MTPQTHIKNANTCVAEALERCHEDIRAIKKALQLTVPSATTSVQRMERVLAALDEEHAGVALLIDAVNELLQVATQAPGA